MLRLQDSSTQLKIHLLILLNWPFGPIQSLSRNVCHLCVVYCRVDHCMHIFFKVIFNRSVSLKMVDLNLVT